MEDQMEQEIVRTIARLEASMPMKHTRMPLPVLLRIAAEELSPLRLLVLFVLTLLAGVQVAEKLEQPMLTMFCTAPMPMLLLFHWHILSCNDRMRELEATLPCSRAEMLAARATVLSCCLFGFLLLLSGALHTAVGTDFLRLALCGAVPNLYLSVVLLFLAGRVRSQESLAQAAVVLWSALCFFSVQLPLDQILQLCSTALYTALAAAGLILYAACIGCVYSGRSYYASFEG